MMATCYKNHLMKVPDLFIKSTTIFLFTFLMLGFVLLKSGCRYDGYIKKSAKTYLEKEKEYDFESLASSGQIDTIRYWETDTFVIIKEYIPSPKSASVFTPEIIFDIIPENYLPADFQETVYENISPASMKVWEKAQELKRKKYSTRWFLR